jgi:hypothetical protein
VVARTRTRKSGTAFSPGFGRKFEFSNLPLAAKILQPVDPRAALERARPLESLLLRGLAAPPDGTNFSARALQHA